MQNKNSLNHLAIIMDGNGRWAINQDLPRTAGHAAGGCGDRPISVSQLRNMEVVARGSFGAVYSG